MEFPQLPAEFSKRKERERPSPRVGIARELPPRPESWKAPDIALAGPKERIPEIDDYIVQSIQDFAWQIDYLTKHDVEDAYPSVSLWVSGYWYASSQSLVEPFGGEAVPNETDPGHWWAKPAVSSPAEALKLEAPRAYGPQIEKYLRAVEYMRESVQGAYPVGGFVLTGPLDTASYIMGFQPLMEAIYEHPKAVHHVCNLVTEFLLSFIPVLLKTSDPNITEAGISTAGCYLCCETRSVLSDAVVAEFEVPYLKPIRDAFGSLHVHACGNWVQHMARLARERYADTIDHGHPECDFKEVARLVGGAVSVTPTTNVSNSDYQMPPEEWYADVFRGIRDDSKVSLSVACGDAAAFNNAYQRVQEEAELALPLRNLEPLLPCE